MKPFYSTRDIWPMDDRVLKKLEGLPVERCKDACFKLLRWILYTLEKFKRLMAKGKALLSWVAWLLSKFLRGEMPEPLEIKPASSSDQKLPRRITALKSWLAMREKEFESEQARRICKCKHTKVEYESGFVDDGSGRWNCMGWARMKLAALEDELHELQKQNARAEAERSYLSLTSTDDQTPRARHLTVQDIAQRFGLTAGQVRRIAGSVAFRMGIELT